MVWLAAFGGCESEYARWVSPDGRFEVHVVSRMRWVAMPGGGGDGPGRMEIVRRSDGRSCGWAPLEMANLASDVTWSGDTARLPFAGTWDLAACTVTVDTAR